MDYTLSVAVSDSTHNRAHQTTDPGFRLVFELGICQVFEELATGDVLHHQVNVLEIVVCFIVLHNIGMIKFLQHSNL